MITDFGQVTEHFNSGEFKCPHCGDVKIDINLIKKVENIFNKLNASLCIVSSGYRCPYYDEVIGGFVGRHSEGVAMDCVFYDSSGKVIPSKIVIYVAYDLGELRGMAIINNNYVHLDNRISGTYYGDETRGTNSYWTNPYSYFNVSKSEVEKYTGSISSFKYQVHGINSKWYSNVLIGNSDYAGILGSPITDVAIDGDVMYRVHVKNKNYWLPWVSGKDFNINDKVKGYAGNGSVIDAIQIK